MVRMRNYSRKQKNESRMEHFNRIKLLCQYHGRNGKAFLVRAKIPEKTKDGYDIYQYIAQLLYPKFMGENEEYIFKSESAG